MFDLCRIHGTGLVFASALVTTYVASASEASFGVYQVTLQDDCLVAVSHYVGSYEYEKLAVWGLIRTDAHYDGNVRGSYRISLTPTRLVMEAYSDSSQYHFPSFVVVLPEPLQTLDTKRIHIPLNEQTGRVRVSGEVTIERQGGNNVVVRGTFRVREQALEGRWFYTKMYFHRELPFRDWRSSARTLNPGEEAFEAAIAASPEDDAPRLAFADFLDEHNQPIRAEFIRIQIEAERLPENDAKRRQLELRARQLELDHPRELLPFALSTGNLAAAQVSFRRGFPVATSN